VLERPVSCTVAALDHFEIRGSRSTLDEPQRIDDVQDTRLELFGPLEGAIGGSRDMAADATSYGACASSRTSFTISCPSSI
jgi:hypothetical protein